MPTETEKGIAPTIRDGQKRLAGRENNAIILAPEVQAALREIDSIKREIQTLEGRLDGLKKILRAA
jgi:hypothetical protein